ncbi:hypothetical protein ACIBKX_16725 [Streptomyces sp. NPDC050658]|uniref:hypothetical protein n=1 Tax=unclassified Streptomyces TaxID=2593676 RepID=UPI003434383D
MSAAAEHPFRLTSARRLAVTDEAGHLADLVRLVLLTGTTERLHRPGFGPGLGATALFEPLPQLLDGLLEMRTKGALERELAGRLLVDRIAVTRLGESALEVTVDYRPLRPPGPAATVSARLEA